MSRRQLLDRFLFLPLASLVGLILRAYPCKRHLRALALGLVREDEPTPSDVIVVLGGGSARRALAGADLFARGLAPRIYLSSDIAPPELSGTGAETSYQLLLQQGVPARAIHHDRRPRTTAEEAQFFGECAARCGWRAALVVTDPWHTRRAIATFRHLAAQRGLRLHLRAVPASSAATAAASWWRSPRACAFVMAEYAALFFYAARRLAGARWRSGPVAPRDARSSRRRGPKRAGRRR
jgi:uncharacterized SAM-binding protein YcdF (DUF218 family)